MLPLSTWLLLVGCAEKAPDADDTASADTADTTDTLAHEPEVCASPSVALTADGTAWIATTDHYRLWIDGFDEDEARNLATLAETAWQGFGGFFGVATGAPFQVFVAADDVGFHQLLAQDGISQPEGPGGYYEPSNGRAYLYRQPTAYYSRVLLLHELVHQYQDHVSGIGGLPFWYVEGLAEALGRHHWDGACLDLRVRPLLSWEDAAADAQAELDAGVDLTAVLSGASDSRPIAQELVRLLTSDATYADRFATWRHAVAGGTSATDLDVFAATIAPVDEVAAALTAFVPADQEPMTPVWLDWVPEGDDTAWGFGDASSAARVKASVDTFAMTTGAPTGQENVGTVYGYDATTGDIELALLAADGSVSRFAVVGGEVSWTTEAAVTPAADVVWSQSAGDDVTTVTIGGESVDLPRALPAAGGVALYAADTIFDDIRWE
jgi:hypothetical protein